MCLIGAELLPDFFLEETPSSENFIKQMESAGAKPAFKETFASTSSASCPPTNTGDPELDATFQEIHNLLSEEVVAKTKASYSFNLKGISAK